MVFSPNSVVCKDCFAAFYKKLTQKLLDCRKEPFTAFGVKPKFCLLHSAMSGLCGFTHIKASGKKRHQRRKEAKQLLWQVKFLVKLFIKSLRVWAAPSAQNQSYNAAKAFSPMSLRRCIPSKAMLLEAT